MGCSFGMSGIGCVGRMWESSIQSSLGISISLQRIQTSGICRRQAGLATHVTDGDYPLGMAVAVLS